MSPSHLVGTLTWWGTDSYFFRGEVWAAGAESELVKTLSAAATLLPSKLASSSSPIYLTYTTSQPRVLRL
ncbi:unnamed protein product [Linum trigynum]|uniref:Uncharacterized protein n=1 Tax=Linum trigynum TaxID=586398 RepID=A0AAV2CWP9_9ROSI